MHVRGSRLQQDRTDSNTAGTRARHCRDSSTGRNRGYYSARVDNCIHHSLSVALWIGYGVVRGDWVIIISNSISLLLLLGILFFKLRGKSGNPPRLPYLTPPRHGAVAKASGAH